MQNGSAARAALRTLRRFSDSIVASGLTRYSYSSSRDGAFIIKEGLRRPILHIPRHRLHIARFSNVTETSMADDAEQGCASNTLEEMNMKEMGSGKSCVSSSSQLLMRLNHLDNMLKQHRRSLALLTSQLEVIFDEIERLQVDTGCKVQSCSPLSHNEATLDVVDVSARSTTDQPKHTWPEWTHFIEHLKSLPFFKESIQVPEVAGVSSIDNSTIIKRMLATFSQAYDYIFDALSVKHLQALADYGCPNDDRRTVASNKRLKDYFEKEKRSDSCEVTSSELASVKPKLLDVMRLIYMIAELAKKDGVPENVKLTIMHLLGEILKLITIHKHRHVARSESFSNAGTVSQNSYRGKSSSVQANLRVQVSSSSTDSESLLGECPSFQQHEKSDPNFDTGMPKSSRPVTNMIDMGVCAQCEEDKEPSVSASNRQIEMPISGNDGQAESMDASPERERLVDAQKQVLQDCILSEKKEKVLSGDGVRDDTDADDHPDIFDDLFDQGNTRSSRAGPECSLSELIRQNKKAFSLTQREREQGAASGIDDLGRKGMRTSATNGQKYDDDNDTNQRDMFHRDDLGRKGMGISAGKGHEHDDDNDTKQRDIFHTDDSDVESGVKYMPQRRGGRGRASSNPSIGINHNHSSKIVGSLGKGRVDDDDRRRRIKSRQRSSSEGDLNSESEAENFVSSRTYGNERPRYGKSKHQGHRDGFLDVESDWRRAFDRSREASSRVW